MKAEKPIEKTGQTHTYVFCGKSEQIAAKNEKTIHELHKFSRIKLIKQAAKLLVLSDSC